MKVCGQELADNMIQRIQERIKEEPQVSRRALSQEVCVRIPVTSGQCFGIIRTAFRSIWTPCRVIKITGTL